MTDEPEHVCRPGATVYYCPASGETESDCHGGFDQCCDRPDLHRPVSTVLRDGLAAALISRIKQAVIPDSTRLGVGGATTSLFAANEFDLADSALGVLTEYLDIGDAEAWCKICRRVWDGKRHRCESDAEQRLGTIREKAVEWAALAPPDDWGDTTQDTVMADVGRFLLQIIDQPRKADV